MRPIAACALLVAAGASPARAEEAARAAPGRGVTLADEDRLGVALKARFQLRYQLARAEEPGGAMTWQDLASVGTARLFVTGHVLERSLGYVVQLAVADRDFRDGARSPIFDAYLDWRASRAVSLRVGQFFVPFDRLRTVREFALQMAERPRPVTELTLDRDVGAALHVSRLFAEGSPLALKIGVFGGEGANASTPRAAGALAVARLELRPLGPIDDDEEGDLARREAPALALGVAAAKNWNTARARSTTGATFAGGTVDFTHAVADLVAKWRGASLQGEYLWRVASADAIAPRATDAAARAEATRSAHGWIAQASYLVVPPLELVARATRMIAFAGTDPAFVQELGARGQELGAGVNLYVNGHAFKVQLSWIVRTTPALDLRGAEHVGYALVDATM